MTLDEVREEFLFKNGVTFWALLVCASCANVMLALLLGATHAALVDLERRVDAAERRVVSEDAVRKVLESGYDN